MSKIIKHQVVIKAAPAKVFGALMNSKKHSQFTGARARISRKVGGTFACYDNYIAGVNLALQPGKFIVQAWRSRNWPAETWSIISIKLSKLSGNRTRLAFTHIGVPSNDYRQKNRGWHTHYWEPLKRFLEKRN